MRTRLLHRRTLLELASVARVEDLISRLAEVEYRAEVEAALARYSGARVVTEAVRLHLARACGKFRTFFAGDGARLMGILLARWDLHNLRAILRGQRAGAQPEQVLEAMIPAGDLGEDSLRTLVHEPDARATGELLRTWNLVYARMVKGALAAFEPTRQWSRFESALDRLFYAWIFNQLNEGAPNDQLVREMLAREMDVLNLLAALRLRASGVTRADEGGEAPFIPGGNLSTGFLRSLMSAEREEAVLAQLRASPFAGAVRGAEG
ncbi:MAG: V-type ATPase subunit, partial [Acidobacteria bacterium]|nr:V-type ATPase subunit [Acidobacteriota bacterium]